MEKKIEAIEDFKNAMLSFSDAVNNTHYSDKSKQEREVDDLLGVLFIHLEKLKRYFSGTAPAEKESKVEELAFKMNQISNSLRQGKIPIMGEVADEFMQALELFDIAREAKEKGKTVALKDKYRRI